jgi:hypothetical protein
LGGGDGSDAGFSEQRWPGRMLLDESEELRVEFGGLRGKEADPGGDRTQCQHGDPVLDAGVWRADELLDPARLSTARRARAGDELSVLTSQLPKVRVLRRPLEPKRN